MLHIGKSTYTGYYFGGLIDEVRISATALYSANFAAGLGGPRGLWKFDGQTANDLSGNGNHGTLQSGATYSTSVPSQSAHKGQCQSLVAIQRSTRTVSSIQQQRLFDPDGTIASYHWNFGDGTSSNSSNPVTLIRLPVSTRRHSQLLTTLV